MRFFVLVGFTLALIGLFNLLYVGVEMAKREPVYACSEITKNDPVDVQKRCKR